MVRTLYLFIKSCSLGEDDFISFILLTMFIYPPVVAFVPVSVFFLQSITVVLFSIYVIIFHWVLLIFSHYLKLNFGTRIFFGIKLISKLCQTLSETILFQTYLNDGQYMHYSCIIAV